ncbi:MAG: molybdopterin-dependent oxidoreductase [Actinobacteria bacterium]|nr:molybdopterin-dependent oxidoreductase [Actinomycetota bacterium]
MRARADEVRSTVEASPVHDERTAAILGLALGVSFTICFVTGLLSHLAQHPTSWFAWPARPAGLYRVTQGLHVATGLASIPLLLAKLWAVFPHLFRWPPFESAAHLVERVMLVPLVFGSVFLLFTGTANVMHWYPWRFSFTRSHYWVAWMTVGALVAHVGAKAGTTVLALRRRDTTGTSAGATAATAGDGVGPAPSSSPAIPSRRAYLGWTAAASGLVTLTTVGQTVWPLRSAAVLAPRRPDIGPQGVPVNGVPSAEVRAAATSADYRFRVYGDVEEELSLTLEELRSLPGHTAALPITCVEGWSRQATWTGVTVSELMARAGVPASATVDVRVESFQHGSAYQYSTMSDEQARDRDALIAFDLGGEPLHMDHGYPARLIAPNRPGVLQTKWVEAIRVTRR